VPGFRSFITQLEKSFRRLTESGLILNRKAFLPISLLLGFAMAQTMPLGRLHDLLAHESPQAIIDGARTSVDSSQAEENARGAASAGALSQLLPHGVCLLWDQSLLLLHVISDSIIALAYYSIPVALIFFVRRRKDLAFSWIFVLFAIFIVACGTTHVLGIWMIWRPAYWLDGIVKALTASVSLVTAILLWPLIPKALALPSPDQLRSAYKELEEKKPPCGARESHEK
jgi:hypothetical protein